VTPPERPVARAAEVADPTRTAVEAEATRSVPPARAIGAWLVLAGVCTALDGAVGAAVAVLVGAVLLAQLPSRVLAWSGVAALLAVPIVLLVRGLPDRDEVSPAFVVGSLVPHHLAFAGVVLVSVAALLDLLARDRDGAARDPVVDVPDRPPLVVAVLLCALVAAGALLATLAVLAT
jgi:putative Ca2+/H+ antiporter (TMEM165/GDT1 family)